MKTIISASRRTDIPAFYYDWLQKALHDEFVVVANPRYPEITYNVSLNPQEVHSIVLWSKDFGNVVANLGELEKYNLYFQWTITGYNQKVEPLVPRYEVSIENLAILAEKFPSKAFNIRFDPIFLSRDAEDNSSIHPLESRKKALSRLCEDMKKIGLEDARITVSYLSIYGNTLNRMKSVGIDVAILNEKQEHRVMRELAEVATSYGYNLYTCANDRFKDIPNILKGHCIDADILQELYGKCSHAKDQAQRLECGCAKSRDIGGYLPCKHGCRYCYANGI